MQRHGFRSDVRTHQSDICSVFTSEIVYNIASPCILAWIIATLVIAHPFSIGDYSTTINMTGSPACHLTYSRTSLLQIGHRIISQESRYRITPHSYNNIQQLGICGVHATRRGAKGGKKARRQGCLQQTAVLGLVNARSIANKTEAINDHITEHNLDILAVTETWLSHGSKHDLELSSICPSGYSITHSPRVGRRGGGLAVIYRDSIAIKPQSKFHAKSFESMELLMTVSSTCIHLVVIYRPPPSKKNNSTTTLFFSEFSTYLESLSIASGRVIIVGDFNFHLESCTENSSLMFTDLTTSVGLKQHVSSPTHTSGHLLDLVLSRPSDNVVHSTKVSSLISDHHAIHCSLNVSRPPLPQKTITYRNLKKLDMEEFQACLQQTPLLLNPSSSLDDLLNQYNTSISNVLDKLAPTKTRTVTLRPVAPWYNDSIHESRKLRRKAEATWRSSGLQVHKEIYCHYRDETNLLIRKAETKNFNKHVEDCGQDQKALFKTIKVGCTSSKT
jgi:hypothetical protein